MSEHVTTLKWSRATHPSDNSTYDRNHQATLSPGVTIGASASPEYKGDPDNVDPEEMLVGALASCHMLTFLAIAELKGFPVESYEGRATGYLEKGESGRPQITRIELQPQISFSVGKEPDAKTLQKMHTSAHKNCFIANSIKAQVEVLES